MKKKDIKDYFKAIQNGDMNRLRDLISEDKAYLTTTNFAPPKKDDGQSGLQLAFKTGNFDVAEYLIKEGADINFMEKSDINQWNTPVLHDCIRACFFNCLTLQKSEDRFEKAFHLLKRMLAQGANAKAEDSYGNNSLHRAILDANQMIRNPINEDTLNQIRRIFKTLIDAGADINQFNENRESFVEFYKSFDLEKYKLY